MALFHVGQSSHCFYGHATHGKAVVENGDQLECGFLGVLQLAARSDAGDQGNTLPGNIDILMPVAGENAGDFALLKKLPCSDRFTLLSTAPSIYFRALIT